MSMLFHFKFDKAGAANEYREPGRGQFVFFLLKRINVSESELAGSKDIFRNTDIRGEY